MSLKGMTSQDFENLLHKAGFSHCSSSGPLKIAVAVSGGADSLALTLLLKAWVKTHGGRLVALTIDHGLRLQSTQEARHLQKMLQDQGIEHHILTWQGEKPSTALQEKAREKRYDLLKTYCLEKGYAFLFLGHHKGDQKETYCMRLRQNSGLLGLACMRALSKHQTLTLVRPFLDVSKEQLQETLKQLKIKWIEDPSNKNTVFERVFWRQSLGDFTPPLDLYQRVRKAYEGWVNRYLMAHTKGFDFGYMRLDQEPFSQLPESFQGILLSFLLQAYGVKHYPPSSCTLKGILEKVKSPKFSAITAQGLRISKNKKELLIIREYRAIKDEQKLLGKSFIWDKRFLITPPKNLTGVIKCIGERGWLQLLASNPALKKLDAPRGALWSLPALWIKEGREIHPSLNAVVENLQSADNLCDGKIFAFKSKFPF